MKIFNFQTLIEFNFYSFGFKIGLFSVIYQWYNYYNIQLSTFYF